MADEIATFLDRNGRRSTVTHPCATARLADGASVLQHEIVLIRRNGH